MTRSQLHELVDKVPEEALADVAEFLTEVIAPAENDAALNDPEYRDYVLARIRQAEAEVDRGETVTLEEAKAQFRHLFEK